MIIFRASPSIPSLSLAAIFDQLLNALRLCCQLLQVSRIAILQANRPILLIPKWKSNVLKLTPGRRASHVRFSINSLALTMAGFEEVPRDKNLLGKVLLQSQVTLYIPSDYGVCRVSLVMLLCA